MLLSGICHAQVLTPLQHAKLQLHAAPYGANMQAIFELLCEQSGVHTQVKQQHAFIIARDVPVESLCICSFVQMLVAANIANELVSMQEQPWPSHVPDVPSADIAPGDAQLESLLSASQPLFNEDVQIASHQQQLQPTDSTTFDMTAGADAHEVVDWLNDFLSHDSESASVQHGVQRAGGSSEGQPQHGTQQQQSLAGALPSWLCRVESQPPRCRLCPACS